MDTGIAIGLAGTILTMVSLIVGARFSESIIWYVNSFRKNKFSGIYESKFGCKDKVAWIVQDYLSIKQSGKQLSGKLYFTKDQSKIYSISGYIKNNMVFGSWTNDIKGYKGSFIWNYVPPYSFEGVWIGPDKLGKLHYGFWNLERKDTALNFDIPNIELTFNKKIHYEALTKFNKRLISNKESSFIIDGLNIDVMNGVFPPQLGEISFEFYNNILKAQSPNNVLDIGTGCGLFALYYAKKGINSTGVDNSSLAVQCAQHNAHKNSIFNVNFIQSNVFDSLDSKVKYDLIIANLPFTKSSLCKHLSKSPYYNSFSSSDDLHKKLILQCVDFLLPNGSVFFTFGTSGNLQLINFLAKLASLKLNIVSIRPRVDELGELFYIMQLTKY